MVGKNQMNVLPSLQDANGVIGIGRRHDLIAGVLHVILEHFTDEKFVFDDQDSWHGNPMWGYHRPRLRADKLVSN